MKQAENLICNGIKSVHNKKSQGETKSGALALDVRRPSARDASMSEQKGRSRLPPPLPNLLGFVLGLICDWLWPWPIARYVYVIPVGVLLVFLVAVLIVMGLRAFKLHGTTSHPYKETTAIIDTGPFRFSRNPGYLTLQILQVALGLLFNSMWILLMTLPALIVVHYVIVLGEEAYLERKFVDSYLDYKSRVRRWI